MCFLSGLPSAAGTSLRQGVRRGCNARAFPPFLGQGYGCRVVPVIWRCASAFLDLATGNPADPHGRRRSR
jgi:hypothetical protein